MSTHQPEVTVGMPHVSVTVVPTGDPQIDAGLEAYLLRQSGVDTVTRRIGDKEVVYNIGLDLKPVVGMAMMDVASAILMYYTSWGMTPQMRAANDL